MQWHTSALNSCYTSISFHIYLHQKRWAHMRGNHYSSDLENKVLTEKYIYMSQKPKWKRITRLSSAEIVQHTWWDERILEGKNK